MKLEDPIEFVHFILIFVCIAHTLLRWPRGRQPAEAIAAQRGRKT
jgi:hypothetical protein